MSQFHIRDCLVELAVFVDELNTKAELSQHLLGLFIIPFELRYNEEARIYYLGHHIWSTCDYEEYPGINKAKQDILQEVRTYNESLVCVAKKFASRRKK